MWIVVEEREDENRLWYYETEERAVENIKHMKIKETQEFLPPRTIRLFEAKEHDTMAIEGYSLADLDKNR